MNEKKEYIIEKANTEDWENLLKFSKETTLFYEKYFLENISNHIERIIVKSENNLKAGIAFEFNNNKIIRNNFLIYSGIIFVHDKTIKTSSKISEEIKITSIILEFLCKNYNQIYLSTFIENNDLRPFSWAYFDDKIKDLKYDLRYTAYLDISSFKTLKKNYSDINNYSLMSYSRKSMISKAFKSSYKVLFDKDKNYLIKSYNELLNKQDQKGNKDEITRLSNLIEAIIKNDKGIFCHIDDHKGNRLYSVFYAWDKHKAYFLFGGSLKDRKTDWAGTIVHWEIFNYLAKNKNLSIVDLEGVNSPKRGYFKTSFGAYLKKYFHINIVV